MRSSEPADPSEARLKAVSCGQGYEREALFPTRACTLAGVVSRVYRRERMRGEDKALRTRLRELSDEEHRRFGCRRLHILLKRKGRELN